MGMRRLLTMRAMSQEMGRKGLDHSSGTQNEADLAHVLLHSRPYDFEQKQHLAISPGSCVPYSLALYWLPYILPHGRPFRQSSVTSMNEHRVCISGWWRPWRAMSQPTKGWIP